MSGATAGAGKAPGLRSLALQPTYDTDTDVLTGFYIPVLERAVLYDRVAGYFSSAALSVAARGIAPFVRAGGRMRLLVGAQLTDADADALAGRADIPPEIAERWARNLITPDEVEAERLRLLAWLVRESRLEVRVAVAVDTEGRPLPQGTGTPYFHEKIGVIRDAQRDGVAFTGSVNETAKAWTRNFESLDVFTSWATPTYYESKVLQFEKRWSGAMQTFRVYPLPEAPKEALIRAIPESWTPPQHDPELPEEQAVDVALAARFLLDAPRMPGADLVAEATTGVRPFPHQTKVVERLAGQFPRSWLVADEVGLGKTISAGLALRRLLLSERVRRVLILAPKNVCRQWQDELFEKFGLWVPRLDGAHFEMADGARLAVGDERNPFTVHPVLIASSHLARRRAHRPKVIEAAPFDLVILDEAHHARRRGFADLAKYDPNHLLRLLDELHGAGKLRTLWLLTATPMQLDPIELRDLLRHVGLGGLWDDWSAFQRFFATLASERPDWRFVARLLAAQFDAGVEPDGALVTQLGWRLPAADVDALLRFHESADPVMLAQSLSDPGREALSRWAKHHSPVGQLVTRHTRQTLRRYRDEGVLTENVADRSVRIEAIVLSLEERDLYEELDELISRLMQAKGTVKGAGFVLTVYRRRLTSSWNAIGRSFLRRLASEGIVDADVDEEDDDELAELDEADGLPSLPLTSAEKSEMRSFHDRLMAVRDSKFERLLIDLSSARERGDGAVVFTQYTDTLEVLKSGLAGSYGSQLAVFSGQGGLRYLDERWVPVSKADLVKSFQSGACSILLGTDAASEGLNLQSVATLINYDLPWNPMRVEQRIGRIDRIGQPRSVVTIINYVIPGTVEDDVYNRLRDRIDVFGSTMGAMQPVLGAAEGAFKRIYGAPKAERKAALARELDNLDRRQREMTMSGLDIDADTEDTLEVGERPEPAVTLRDLRRVLAETAQRDLAAVGIPSTFDPSLASRDAESLAALATYGHPGVSTALVRLARGPLPEAIVRAEDGGVVAFVRADRVPPQPIYRLEDLDGGTGPALAAGEATELADRLVREEGQRRAADETGLLRQARQQALQRRRADFIETVRRGVAAYCRLQRVENGLTVSPAAALDQLPSTDQNWLSVAAVAASLRIDPSELHGDVDGGPGTAISDAATLRSAVADATRRLRLIFESIRAGG